MKKLITISDDKIKCIINTFEIIKRIRKNFIEDAIKEYKDSYGTENFIKRIYYYNDVIFPAIMTHYWKISEKNMLHITATDNERLVCFLQRYNSLKHYDMWDKFNCVILSEIINEITNSKYKKSLYVTQYKEWEKNIVKENFNSDEYENNKKILFSKNYTDYTPENVNRWFAEIEEWFQMNVILKFERKEKNENKI